jgi:hypothetical protein
MQGKANRVERMNTDIWMTTEIMGKVYKVIKEKRGWWSIVQYRQKVPNLRREEKHEVLNFHVYTMNFDSTFKDEAQTALFKEPVRTAL